MPVVGGTPQRRTWDGDATPAGWSPDGRLIVQTNRYSTLPDNQLILIGSRGDREAISLATASEAAYSPDGKVLFFTRSVKQWSQTKRYKGGWAENIWRFDGHSEALPLTSDFAGTSHAPIFANGQVYFLSHRDGAMNVLSMD